MDEPPSRTTEETLHRYESLLRAFTDQSQDMITRVDRTGRIVEINAAGVKLLGYEEASQLLGRVERELWSNPADHEVFTRLMRENGLVANFEVMLTRRDGSTMFGLENASLIGEPDGSGAEIHATVKDISERIRDTQAMWKLNMELAEANRKLTESQAMMVQQEKLASIGQLAAGIAHEINNPLGFLKSNYSTLGRYVRTIERFLRIVAERGDPDMVKARATFEIDHILSDLDGILHDCDDGFRRIADIVLTLTNFSRVDSGGARAPFDINRGVQGALTVAHNEVKYVADVSLDLATLPPVSCVEGEIMQVLLNVLVNAAQAIRSQHRKQKGRIAVRSGRTAEVVWVEIEDDGPGIPPDLRSKIFDPFFTTKPVGQGTGLGLSISYDIIHRHGGSLTVRSEPDHGACFRIELPLGAGTFVAGRGTLPRNGASAGGKPGPNA